MIKKILVISLFFGLQSLLLPVANAAKTLENCDEIKDNTIEYSQCLDVVKEAVDRELQTWINNQIFTLEELALVTGRKSALAMFKRSQKNFITFRENNCRWQYLAISPSIQAAPAYKRCYILLSKTRIKELDRLGKSGQ